MLIKPMDAALGAEVTGIDLARINIQEFRALYDTWLEHCVLVVRQQSLTEASLVDFSRRLGELELPPGSESRVTGDGGASLPGFRHHALSRYFPRGHDGYYVWQCGRHRGGSPNAGAL